MLYQFLDRNRVAAMSTAITAGVTTLYAAGNVGRSWFSSFLSSTPDVVTQNPEILNPFECPKLADFCPFYSNEVVTQYTELLNPFEWLNTCPKVSDVCPFYSNMATEYSFSSQLSSYVGQLTETYAQPLISVGSQGIKYLPMITEIPNVISMIQNTRKGYYQAAVKKALDISANAMISIAIDRAGIVALPAGYIVKYGIMKAYERVYGPSSSLALNPYRRAADQLGINIQKVGDNAYQVSNQSGVLGRPISEQSLAALAKFTSNELEMTQLKEASIDWEKQTIEFNQNGIHIPFSEIEALYRLMYEDLPELVQLGIISLRLPREGQMQLIFNREELQNFAYLPEGVRDLVRIMDRQPTKGILDIRANTSALNKLLQDKIISYQEAGVVPVQTDNGQILVSKESVGDALSKAFRIDQILSSAQPDGKLHVRVLPPVAKDGAIRIPRPVEVPVIELQRVAHAVVEAKKLSLAEQQENHLRACGF